MVKETDVTTGTRSSAGVSPEGARRATGGDTSAGAAGADPLPDPEVLAKARRRTHSAAYKLRILRQVDACTAPGEVSALLRREGLYSSHLTEWRRARDRGALHALEPVKRGPKVKSQDPQAAELARLRKENARLQERLRKAELILDVQKKVAQLLGLPLQTPGSDENS